MIKIPHSVAAGGDLGVTAGTVERPPTAGLYLPMRKDELCRCLERHGELSAADGHSFRKLCDLIETVLHHDYHELQEHLKRLYGPFDPDAETLPLCEGRHRPRHERLDEFLRSFSEVLAAAHYRPLSSDELEFALSGATYWGLDLQINRDIFERLMIYVRGESERSRLRRDLSTWFRARAVDLEVFQRLVLVVKLRRGDRGETGSDTEGVHIKMFREIPKLDLEMLLPGTRARIRWFDAGKIGSSSVAGIFSLFKMALETVFAGKLKWFMLGIGALAYAVQSFLGYRRTKASYVYTMTQQLYYQNLDNNVGAFCRIIDEAEDEETKEAILAYYFLWRHAAADWTAERLAEAVNRMVAEETGVNCRFEGRDAIGKLQRLGLLANHSRHLEVYPPSEAIGLLARRFADHLAAEFPSAQAVSG